MRVCFTNMGCKLNQAEIEQLARDFRAAGHQVVGSLAEADLHVVNSCTVTHVAAREARKIARRGSRQPHPVRTVLTGCYPAAEPAAAAALRGVDLVVPNHEKDRLLERVHQAFPECVPAPPPADALPVPFVPLPFGHARAMVKIGDGCAMRCSFCIIPFTRGGESSRRLDEIVAEVDGLARAGYREVVVTGVQISSYRQGGARLYDLVRALLDGTRGTRLRLTSIAPWDVDERLYALFSDRRLCRHLHFSLQSGSSATLRRMRRPYSADDYAAVVERARRAIDGLAVTTDVIVGFPGEDAAEFAESLAFVERIGFARCHVFPYSPRAGTAAAEWGDQVTHEVKKERTAALLEVAAASERAFWRANLGQCLDVLWEQRRGERWHGLTDNYIRVQAAAAPDPAVDARRGGRVTPARLLSLGESAVLGRIQPAAGG